MPHERFFINSPLETHTRVMITDLELRHLSQVMRMRVGETVELVNGRNLLAHATIETLCKDRAELTIVQIYENTKPKRPLILMQAIPRMTRLEYILEKGTELNVSEFWIFPGLLSENDQVSVNQRKRMELILISAMKQCGRLDLPRILFTPPLLTWDNSPGTLLFGDLACQAPYLWEKQIPHSLTNPLALVIGPEKGLSPKETQHLREKLLAEGVRLHPNILRTDTASITGLSLMQLFCINL